ncbi:TlpA family protein disulfide reductase [Sphingobacterium sp. MYb382]|uniref:TlpA family protein disulfide reductase n=1 Tax=Sphingobacterium sp. MYb382 TaxID=2745278 RepID=UPI00309A06B1
MDKKLRTHLKKCLYICFLLISGNINAQQVLQIPLKADSTVTIMRQIFYGVGKPISEKSYLNMPKGMIRQYAIAFEIDSIQSAYERLVVGNNDTLSWKKFTSENNIDTLAIYEGKLRNSTLGIFHGIDSLNRKIIVFDENGNKDFSDDRVHMFPLANKSDTVVPLSISFQYYNNRNIKDTVLSLNFYPYQSFEFFVSNDYSDLILYMFNRVNLASTYSSKQFNYNFNIAPEIVGNNILSRKKQPFDKPYRMNTVDKSGKVLQSTFHRLNDTIYFAGADWRMLDYDNRNIIFEQVRTSDSGYQVGQNFQGFPDFTDYFSGDFIDSISNSKYVLIDFWGTWCGPCIAAIPELVEFWKQNSDKLILISVLYDDKSKIEEAKSIIKNNNMNWLHVHDERKSSSWVKPMGVTSFPGFILIGKDRKVLLNSDNAVTPLSEIQNIISK